LQLMKFKAQQIADILEGEVEGNPNEEVSKLSKIEEGEKGSLTFLSNPKYIPHIYTTNASVAIIDKSFILEKETAITLIKVDNAYKSFSKLLSFYNEVKNDKEGRETPHFIAESASIGANGYLGAFSYIGENVSIGDNVKIYPNTYIGDNTIIGDDCVIYAGVKIYSETKIGNHCKIHSGCIIGSDGFGFTPDANGHFKAVPQIGNVIIEDHVDIGSGSTIDRATLGSTVIRQGVKLDNQIQIAHNVEIGKDTVIAAQTGIAGSTKIGKNCMIGGQVGIVGHITIGNGAKIQAQSGVTKSIKDNEVVQGTPAFNYNDFNKSYIHFRNLPKFIASLSDIKKEFNTQKEN